MLVLLRLAYAKFGRMFVLCGCWGLFYNMEFLRKFAIATLTNGAETGCNSATNFLNIYIRLLERRRTFACVWSN